MQPPTSMIQKESSLPQYSAHSLWHTGSMSDQHQYSQPSVLGHAHNSSNSVYKQNGGDCQKQIHIPSPLPPQDSFNSPIAGSRRSDLEGLPSPLTSLDSSSPVIRHSTAPPVESYSKSATPQAARVPNTPHTSSLQEMPPVRRKTEAYKSPSTAVKTISSAAVAAVSLTAVGSAAGCDQIMTSPTPSNSSPLSPVDRVGIATPADISEDSPPGLVRNIWPPALLCSICRTCKCQVGHNFC
jgi:hypothetical protein